MMDTSDGRLHVDNLHLRMVQMTYTDNTSYL